MLPPRLRAGSGGRSGDEPGWSAVPRLEDAPGPEEEVPAPPAGERLHLVVVGVVVVGG